MNYTVGQKVTFLTDGPGSREITGTVTAVDEHDDGTTTVTLAQFPDGNFKYSHAGC